MKRVRFIIAATLLVGAAAFVAASLYTDLGVLVVGHRYWMRKAVAATTDEETDRHLRRVLNGTQYGVNMAENWVRTVPDRGKRVHLWRRLIFLAPNDIWQQLYGYRLEAEFGRGPLAATHPAKESR